MDIFDFLPLPFYLAFIYLVSKWNANRHIENEPHYKYYTSALFVKILGGILFCMVYTYYYGGGDTINYYNSDVTMLKLMQKDFGKFFSLEMGDLSSENLAAFDINTGWPSYYKDSRAFLVVRMTTPICFLGLRSFLVTTVLLDWICFLGFWKLYKLLCSEFPELRKQFIWALFFIPSVVFWGSGLMKDTITLSAICWFTYSIYKGLILKQNILMNILYLLISVYFIISIKSYILYTLLPGVFLWWMFSQLKTIKIPFIRIGLVPMLLAVGFFSLFALLKELGNEMGKFNVNEILDRVVITQQDLVKDYYGGNTFDVGKFDASIPSMIRKFPIALVSGLFRPFIWESRNPVMLVSGIENLILIIYTFIILLRLRVFRLFSILFKNPFLLYSFSFAIFLGYSVGISTPNFGSLVRYRIPSILFYVLTLIIVKYYYDLGKKQQEEKEKEEVFRLQHRNDNGFI